MTLNRHSALNSVLCWYIWSSEAWLSKLRYSLYSECCRRTLSQKEQLRAAASRGFLATARLSCFTFLFYTLEPTSAYVNRSDVMLQWHVEMNKLQIFTLMLLWFSSSAKFKMLDCMSNFQCHCCSKLYRKQNFQVLKPNVNCVTFAASCSL